MGYPLISLKAARINANMTQKEVSEKLGISVATIQNYENGKSFPDIITIRKLENLYKFPSDYIFFESNNA